jgi:hypothetical protein
VIPAAVGIDLYPFMILLLNMFAFASLKTAEETMFGAAVIVRGAGVAGAAVTLAIIELAARLAIFDNDTVPAPMVVDIVALPEPETSPVKVCDWLEEAKLHVPATEAIDVHAYCPFTPDICKLIMFVAPSWIDKVPVLLLITVNMNPTVNVVASGSTTVCDNVPVNSTYAELDLDNVVVPDAVTIDAKPSVR